VHTNMYGFGQFELERKPFAAETSEFVNHMAIWAAVLDRASEILPCFADLRLDMRATVVATILGLERSDQLGRWLRRHKLPPFRLLRNWIYIVRLAEQNAEGISLSGWALAQGRYPSMYYRLVVETTGLPWHIIRTLAPQDVVGLALRAWDGHLREGERVRGRV
jgi:hypothetical protein